VSDPGRSQAEDGLPAGMSVDDAEGIVQGRADKVAALVGKLKANRILRQQPEYINFFAQLPDEAWLDLRQALVDAGVPIRDIDRKIKSKREEILKAAARDPGRETCFRLAVALKAQGASFEVVREALINHTDQKARDWARASNTADLRRLYDNASPKRLLQVSEFVAYSPKGQAIFISTGDLWVMSSVDDRVPPQALVDSMGNPVFDADGVPKTQSASSWLVTHAPVEQMTWAPGEPQIIKDRLMVVDGWITKKAAAAFNLYQPPPALPSWADPAKAERWLNHGRELYPDDFDHICKFFAHRRQRPQEKINHALLLGGDPGIGKDTLVAPLRSAVGPGNFRAISPVVMMGRFNGFNRCVVLQINEVRDLGDVNRFVFYEHMKVYCAAPPETLLTDEKHRGEYYVLNVCGVIMLTNYKVGGIYLPADDRRTYVAWSLKKAVDYPVGHWSAFWQWLEAEGFAHVGAYLQGLDLSNFDPKAPPPKTGAFWEIVNSNRSTDEAELSDIFEQLGNPAAVVVDTVVAKARELNLHSLAMWMEDRKNRGVIPIRFEKCGYTAVRNDAAASDGLFKIGMHRKVVYARSNLSQQQRLDSAALLTGRRP
jgi:hypothetical protein